MPTDPPLGLTSVQIIDARTGERTRANVRITRGSVRVVNVRSRPFAFGPTSVLRGEDAVERAKAKSTPTRKRWTAVFNIGGGRTYWKKSTRPARSRVTVTSSSGHHTRGPFDRLATLFARGYWSTAVKRFSSDGDGERNKRPVGIADSSNGRVKYDGNIRRKFENAVRPPPSETPFFFFIRSPVPDQTQQMRKTVFRRILKRNHSSVITSNVPRKI